ncbi:MULTISPECIES: hypothetical protein [unclassified Streptomyces]|uniref:hypothetical protein n=1 Tax=unclassified Streptomyces TaxID=2593676 RepID=UPI002DD9B6CD|nr:hypothetical protein [Streptomyces sp. NBC_01445]
MSIRPPPRHRSSPPARGERRSSARPDCGSPPQELLQIAQTLGADGVHHAQVETGRVARVRRSGRPPQPADFGDFPALISRTVSDLTNDERNVLRSVSLLDAFSVPLATQVADRRSSSRTRPGCDPSTSTKSYAPRSAMPTTTPTTGGPNRTGSAPPSGRSQRWDASGNAARVAAACGLTRPQTSVLSEAPGDLVARGFVVFRVDQSGVGGSDN